MKSIPFHYNQLTTDSFVKKALEIYGDRYDYSLVQYDRSNAKVKIICPQHGVFETAPNNHLRKMGNCPKCAEISRANKRRMILQEFLDRVREIHKNKYDYSKTEYVSVTTPVKIICPKHGEFLQIPQVHLAGKGCRECSDEKHRLTVKDFLNRAKKIHENKYDYSLVVYLNGRKKIQIGCPKHGVFEQTAASHLKGNGCPSCKESRGERKIAFFLNFFQIGYKRGKSFSGCRNVYRLFFDFYIPTLNTCIEYDGLQHFSPIEYFGGQPVFEYTKKLDAIKTAYCAKAGIKLIRIPYTKKDPEIASVLKEELGLSISHNP